MRLVLDTAFFHQPGSHLQLSIEDRDRPRTELDPTILAGFGAIFVDTIHARLGDTKNAADWIVVAHGERDFFRRPKPGEKSKLLVVAVGFAPVLMQRGDKHFRILDAEGIAERRRGGLILAGAKGAENGVPCMANDGAAKAYVQSLGEALHYEFKPLGVYVTVLAAGFTNTAVLEKFGLDSKTMPMKPMSVEQCVSEGL